MRNGPADGPKSSAEKFEDEKKRIIRTCYSKKDSDGNRTWNSPPLCSLGRFSRTLLTG